MNAIKKVGLVGGGVIGAGWAARFLLNGSDVALFDPDPEIARKMEAVLGNARTAYAKLYPGLLPKEGTLSIVGTVAEAVTGADFIQESLPEREDLKIKVLAEIDRAARPDVIVGSSTSGLLPSRLQSGMARPERLVVGHPFNPVYLLPLVEICGGDKTSAETKQRAAEIYSAIGMYPLQVRKEIDGFIADRLLEALWREALWLVNDGIATTEEIDDAIRFGAGLRFSFMGTFLIYRVAGGEAGMRHFLAQFGPALKLPWTKLVAPELTDELVDKVAGQSDDQAAGKSIRELEALRDNCLVSVVKALSANGYGAGAASRAYAERLAAGLPSPGLIDEGQPLRLHRAQVEADWIDYNGHMTEHRYLQVFGDSTDALLRYVGASGDYVEGGYSYYTVESHLMHRDEGHEGDALEVTTQILGADPKRIRLFHTLLRSSDQVVLASAEQMLLHVDSKAGKACPARDPVINHVLDLAQAQAHLPVPAAAGRNIAALGD